MDLISSSLSSPAWCSVKHQWWRHHFHHHHHHDQFEAWREAQSQQRTSKQATNQTITKNTRNKETKSNDAKYSNQKAKQAKKEASKQTNPKQSSNKRKEANKQASKQASKQTMRWNAVNGKPKPKLVFILSWHLQPKLPMVCPMTSKVAFLSIAAPWANKVSKHSSALKQPRPGTFKYPSNEASLTPHRRATAKERELATTTQLRWAGGFVHYRCHDYVQFSQKMCALLRTRRICLNCTKSIGRRYWKQQQTH